MSPILTMSQNRKIFLRLSARFTSYDPSFPAYFCFPFDSTLMILSNQILFIHSKNSFGKRNNKGIVQQKPMKALFVRIPASIQSTLWTTMIGNTKRTQRNTLCPTERKPYAPYWFTSECLRSFCTLGVRDGESDGRAVRRAEAGRFFVYLRTKIPAIPSFSDRICPISGACGALPERPKVRGPNAYVH